MKGRPTHPPEQDLETRLAEIKAKQDRGERVRKEDMLSLGLLHYRVHKGWDKKQMADFFKVTKQNVYEWETGRRFPTIQMLELILTKAV